MIKLSINKDKFLQINGQEQIYKGENKISKFLIQAPSKIAEYRTSDLSTELRVCFPDGNFMSYNIQFNNALVAYQDITNDITEKAQDIYIMLLFTKDGNVIGKTNKAKTKVKDAPDSGEPLVPREQFNERIEELESEVSVLENDKADLENEITAKNATIAEKNTRIGELTNTVADLSAEIEELEEQHSEDVHTIENLTAQLNNSRLINLDITVNNLDFFDSLSSNISVSGSVYVDGVILLSDKQRIETKFPQLSVTAEYIIDFTNFMLALTGGVIVDSDGNVLTFETGGAYQSNYTASDIDNFINTVSEEIEILEEVIT